MLSRWLAIGRVGQWATGGLCILIEAIASQTWVCAGESEERDFSTNEFRRGLNLAIWAMLYCCILLDTYSCPCCTRWGLSVDWVFSTSSHQGILEAVQMLPYAFELLQPCLAKRNQPPQRRTHLQTW